MNHNNFDDISEEGFIDDLDALLESELAQVDENAEFEPALESEHIKTQSHVAPFFDEYDGVMAELLASSRNLFVDAPQLVETVEMQTIEEDILPVFRVELHKEAIKEFAFKDLHEEEQKIMLQLMELIVESVVFSVPVVNNVSEVQSIVEKVECNLQLFDETQQVVVEESVLLQPEAVATLSQEELLRLQELTEGLIKSEEALGQAAISQVDEELQRENERIAERNRKREKQRQLAQRNAMATRIQCLYRKTRARRKVQKLREFTQRKKAVEAIQQQKKAAEAEAERSRQEAAAAAQREKEQREREEQEEAARRHAEELRKQLLREQEEMAARRAAEEAAAAREEALRREMEQREAEVLLDLTAEAVVTLMVEEWLTEQCPLLAEGVWSDAKNESDAAAAVLAASARVPSASKREGSAGSRGERLFDLSLPDLDVELQQEDDTHLLNDSMDSQMDSDVPVYSSASIGASIVWDNEHIDLSTVQVPAEVVQRRVKCVDYSYLDSLQYASKEGEDDGMPVFAPVNPACLIQFVPESQVIASSSGSGASRDLEECLRCWQQTHTTLFSSGGIVEEITTALNTKLAPTRPVKGKARGVYYDATDFTKSVENVTSVEDISRIYPNLIKLNLKVNLIRGLKGLDALFRLQELNLNDNKIESVQEVSQLKYLQTLQLDSNMVRNIECLNDQLPMLTALSLNMNRLSVMPTLRLPSLKKLEMHHNDLKELPNHCLDGLPSLTVLDLGSNKLRTVDGSVFSRCPLLQSLILSHNALISVPSPLHLPLLKHLWLSGNQIADLSPWSAGAAPGKNSVTWPLCTPMLQRLVLTGNQITSLPSHMLSTLPLLIDLDLSFNAITSRHDLTALREATTLQVLQIHDNKILNTLNPQTVTPESGQFKTKADMVKWLQLMCPQLKKVFDEEVPKEENRVMPEYHSNAVSGCGSSEQAAVHQSTFHRRFLQLLSEFQAASLCTNAVLRLSSDDKPLAESNADVRLLCAQYQTLLSVSESVLSEKEPFFLSLSRPVPLPVNQLIALQSAFRGFRVRRRLQEALSTHRRSNRGDSEEQRGEFDDDEPWGDEAEDNSLIQDMLNIDISDYTDFDSESVSSAAVPMVYGDHIRKRKNSKRSMDENDPEVLPPALREGTRREGASVPLVMDDELSRPASASSEISNLSLPLGASASTPQGSAVGADRLHHYSNMSPLSSARSGYSGIADVTNRNKLINPNSVAAEWDSANPGVLASLMRNNQPPRQPQQPRPQDSDSVSRATKTTVTRPQDISRKNLVSMSANTSNYVKSGSFGGKVIHVRRGHGGGGGGKKVNKPAWLKGEDVEDVEES